jgi:proline-specific peptidase
MASSAQQVPSTEHRIDVPGGRVWCAVVGRESARTPLLCLHGGPGFPSAYLDSLRELGDERQVVLYDQLGCGNSDRPDDLSLFETERFVEEVGAVRRALGLERVHLLGQSWGGMLALLTVLDDPSGIESIVFASAAIDVPRWVDDCNALKAELPEKVRDSIDRHEHHGRTGCLEYAAASYEWWKRHVCRLDPWPDTIERAFEGFGGECYETMWGPSEFTCTGRLKGLELSGRLPEVTQPTLFTCGRYDESTPASNELFAGQMPDAELRVFEDSSHTAHLEEEQAYLAVLREFLGRHDRV